MGAIHSRGGMVQKASSQRGDRIEKRRGRSAAPSLASVTVGVTGDLLAAAILDALPAMVIVLDCEGTITYANRAWERYAHVKGLTPAPITIGCSYLDVCRRAAGGSPFAREAVEGIEAVLSGQQNA